MIPYQRYLREKKETQEEQDLEEARKQDRMNLSPDSIQRIKDAESGKAKPRVTSDPGGTGFQRAASVATDKSAGNKARTLGNLRNRLTDKQPTDTPGAYPAISSANKPSFTDTMRTPPKTKISPDSVSGNTISEIISSAGGNSASVLSVIQAVKSALQKSGLELKDTSFLV